MSRNRTNRGNRAEVNIVDEAVDVVAEETPEEVYTMPKQERIGIVTDCMNLNIRKSPDQKADVVCVVPALTELAVNLEDSTDGWYSVNACIESVVYEGYCMRRFIAIK